MDMEQPRVTAALLSLVGVGCVVSRQWCAPPTALDKCAHNFWRVFATDRKTVLQALATCRTLKGTSVLKAEAGTEVSGDTETDKAAVGVTVMKPLRRWIRYAEVTHGIGNITYTA